MLSAIRSTILSRRSWLASGSAIVSRNWRKRMRGPPIAVAMLFRPADTRPYGDLTTPEETEAAPGQGGARLRQHDGRLSLGLVQPVIGMQSPNCKLRIFLIDQHRGLDFRGGDQLDVDSLFRKRPEHRGGDPRMATHAHAHDGNLGPALGPRNRFIFEIGHGAEHLHGPVEFAVGHR